MPVRLNNSLVKAMFRFGWDITFSSCLAASRIYNASATQRVPDARRARMRSPVGHQLAWSMVTRCAMFLNDREFRGCHEMAQDESITGSALGSSWHDEVCIEKGMLVTSNTKSMNWCETKRDYHSRAEAHQDNAARSPAGSRLRGDRGTDTALQGQRRMSIQLRNAQKRFFAIRVGGKLGFLQHLTRHLAVVTGQPHHPNSRAIGGSASLSQSSTPGKSRCSMISGRWGRHGMKSTASERNLLYGPSPKSRNIRDLAPCSFLLTGVSAIASSRQFARYSVTNNCLSASL